MGKSVDGSRPLTTSYHFHLSQISYNLNLWPQKNTTMENHNNTADEETMMSRIAPRLVANGTGKSLSNYVKGVAELKGRHLTSIYDLSVNELNGLLDLSSHLKNVYRDKSDGKMKPKPLDSESVAMIFQKRSTRTRVSTETGMNLLGGSALFLGPSDIQLGVNESMRDTAEVLSRFNSIVLARVYSHDDITELAKYSKVPIINALSDLHHPLQTLADLMTLREHFSESLSSKTLSWVGDGNNIIHDLVGGCALLGMNVNIATPIGYECDASILEQAQTIASRTGSKISFTTDPVESVTGADVVVTDTWVSMGQEDEYKKRVKDFEGYQVTSALMSKANPDAVFLHCLPRHIEEVTDEVMYSPASLVFPEAENRMWTVMAVMAAQLGKIEL